MTIQEITWSQIEVQGKSTGEYICSQHLNALLRHDEKDAALKHKFIAEKCTAQCAENCGNGSRCLDMTHEDVYIENVSPELDRLLAEHRFVVIAGFDAHTNCEGEDPPSIVITNDTTFYPVRFVDCV